jgi:hypothetical protein
MIASREEQLRYLSKVNLQVSILFGSEKQTIDFGRTAERLQTGDSGASGPTTGSCSQRKDHQVYLVRHHDRQGIFD